MLTLAGSRYVLVEPPHHVMPPRLEDFFFELLAAGYVPILTHPERLTWAAENYELLEKIAVSGVWMQLTSGSFTGLFGKSARYFAEKMLDGGLVHIIASDAHNMQKRPPNLLDGFELVAKRAGKDIALDLVVTRPRGVLENAAPESMPIVTKPNGREKRESWFGLRA